MTNSTWAASHPLDPLRSHLKISVGVFYSHLTNRLLLYFLLVALFIFEGLLALAVYKGPSILISHMAFATVYALHTALTFTFCQFATDVMACRFIPVWGRYQERTVSKQWLIWSAGFVLAFVLHRTLILCMVHIYAPDVVAYYADARHVRPSHGAAFLYILSFWIAGVFLAVNFLIMVQRRLTARNRPDGRKLGETLGSLKVCTNNRIFEIPYAEISHISVEDHYSRIYFIKGHSIQNVFIRTALKALLQSLPHDLFFQIHRSHLINLAHVSGLSKNKQELRIRWTQIEVALPVSRHRLSELVTRLMDLPTDQNNQHS